MSSSFKIDTSVAKSSGPSSAHSFRKGASPLHASVGASTSSPGYRSQRLRSVSNASTASSLSIVSPATGSSNASATSLLLPKTSTNDVESPLMARFLSRSPSPSPSRSCSPGLCNSVDSVLGEDTVNVTSAESEYVLALHDYTPQQGAAATCLSFHAGQVIHVLNRDPSGWWDGQVEGRRGWFPSNYVSVDVGSLADEELPPSPFGKKGHVASHSTDSGASWTTSSSSFSSRRNTAFHSERYSHIRTPSILSSRNIHRSSSRSSCSHSRSSSLVSPSIFDIAPSSFSFSSTSPVPSFVTSTQHCHPLMLPLLHSLSLLQTSVRSQKIQHYSPAVFWIVKSIRAVLADTETLAKDAEVLKLFPEMARERSRILVGLKLLVELARIVAVAPGSSADDADPTSESPQVPPKRQTDPQDLLKIGGQIFAHARKFLALAVQCGLDLPLQPSSLDDTSAEGEENGEQLNGQPSVKGGVTSRTSTPVPRSHTADLVQRLTVGGRRGLGSTIDLRAYARNPGRNGREADGDVNGSGRLSGRSLGGAESRTQLGGNAAGLGEPSLLRGSIANRRHKPASASITSAHSTDSGYSFVSSTSSIHSEESLDDEEADHSGRCRSHSFSQRPTRANNESSASARPGNPQSSSLPPLPTGPTTSPQIIDLLRSTHDSFLSTIAAFIGHAHSHSRTSHASTAGHLFELVKEIIEVVCRILTVVEAVIHAGEKSLEVAEEDGSQEDEMEEREDGVVCRKRKGEPRGSGVGDNEDAHADAGNEPARSLRMSITFGMVIIPPKRLGDLKKSKENLYTVTNHLAEEVRLLTMNQDRQPQQQQKSIEERDSDDVGAYEGDVLEKDPDEIHDEPDSYEHDDTSLSYQQQQNPSHPRRSQSIRVQRILERRKIERKDEEEEKQSLLRLATGTLKAGTDCVGVVRSCLLKNVNGGPSTAGGSFGARTAASSPSPSSYPSPSPSSYPSLYPSSRVGTPTSMYGYGSSWGHAYAHSYGYSAPNGVPAIGGYLNAVMQPWIYLPLAGGEEDEYGVAEKIWGGIKRQSAASPLGKSNVENAVKDEDEEEVEAGSHEQDSGAAMRDAPADLVTEEAPSKFEGLDNEDSTSSSKTSVEAVATTTTLAAVEVMLTVEGTTTTDSTTPLSAVKGDENSDSESTDLLEPAVLAHEQRALSPDGSTEPTDVEAIDASESPTASQDSISSETIPPPENPQPMRRSLHILISDDSLDSLQPSDRDRDSFNGSSGCEGASSGDSMESIASSSGGASMEEEDEIKTPDEIKSLLPVAVEVAEEEIEELQGAAEEVIHDYRQQEQQEQEQQAVSEDTIQGGHHVQVKQTTTTSPAAHAVMEDEEEGEEEGEEDKTMRKDGGDELQKKTHSRLVGSRSGRRETSVDEKRAGMIMMGNGPFGFPDDVVDEPEELDSSNSDPHLEGPSGGPISIQIPNIASKQLPPPPITPPPLPPPKIVGQQQSLHQQGHLQTLPEPLPTNPLTGPDYGREDIAYNHEGFVVGGTLEALVAKMTPHDAIVDPVFSSVFFMTFRMFCTPMQLVDALIARYNISPPAYVSIAHLPQAENFSQEEYLNYWRNAKGLPIRLRVSNFVKNWVETYWKVGSDSVVIDELLKFTREGLGLYHPGPAQRIVEMLEVRQQQFYQLQQMMLSEQGMPPPPSSTSSNGHGSDTASLGRRSSTFSMDESSQHGGYYGPPPTPMSATMGSRSLHSFDRLRSDSAMSALNPSLPLASSSSSTLPQGGAPLLPLSITSMMVMSSSPTAYTSQSSLSEIPRPSMTRALLANLRNRNWNTIVITDFDALELARQLTIMEITLYCKILPEEVLECGEGSSSAERRESKASEKSAGTTALSATGNVAGKQVTPGSVKALATLSTVITGWVAECILSEMDIKKRTQLIKFFIKVADRCVQLNNYSTSRSILAALDSSTIARLHQTWAGIPQKHKAVFESLRKLADHTRNYYEYRTKLRNTAPPAVPFLGLYLTDITFCREGNPSMRLSPLDHSKKLINFNKYLKLARIVQDLQRFQMQYNLKAIPEAQEYLNMAFENAKNHGDLQDLYRRSLFVEPRQPADQPPPSGEVRQLFTWALRSTPSSTQHS